MKKLLIIALTLGTAGLYGQSFDAAARQAGERLDRSLEERDSLMAEITDKRPELGARLDEVERRAMRLRDQSTTALRVRAGFDVEVSQLRTERQNVIDNNRYIQSTLLNEYIRRLEISINPAEIPLYGAQIREAISYLETEDDIDDATIFEEQLKVVQLALDRTQKMIGGHQFSGPAIVAGVFKDGDFSVIGPASYFSANDGSAAGMTYGMIDNRANIYVLPNFADAITRFNETGSGTLPVDTTAGEALTTITYDITLWEEWGQGGFVIWFILGLFAAAILIVVFKFIELFGVKPARDKDIQEILGLLRSNNKSGAAKHAQQVGGPVGDMLVAAVENFEEDKEVIEEILYEKIVKTQPRLEKYLPFVAVVAATAPLMGLLGTVTGMIKTFKLITIVGTGDARNLSSGISEALITTKWGLIVAIPTLICHALLNRKAKGVVGSMEQAAVSFINGVSEMRGESDKS